MATATTARQQRTSKKRGFAAMDEERQRQIASMGGKASGGNFARDRKKASIAGKKGGEISRRT
jgi:general stress protein YciG